MRVLSLPEEGEQVGRGDKERPWCGGDGEGGVLKTVRMAMGGKPITSCFGTTT